VLDDTIRAVPGHRTPPTGTAPALGLLPGPVSLDARLGPARSHSWVPQRLRCIGNSLLTRRDGGELVCIHGSLVESRLSQVNRAFQSPTTVMTSVRWRPRTSHSRWKICCQVPSTSFPSAIGTVKDGPSSVACRCECPLPSCQVCSWP
jgi:hypothetical protein